MSFCCLSGVDWSAERLPLPGQLFPVLCPQEDTSVPSGPGSAVCARALIPFSPQPRHAQTVSLRVISLPVLLRGALLSAIQC